MQLGIYVTPHLDLQANYCLAKGCIATYKPVSLCIISVHVAIHIIIICM